ncbi:hypothetical protein Ciccas_008058 [Cichlidogyrus casuarinus]|uniref:Uncharacterized protein n=1 Tax=Cichlidogyrus casuarinus TaxID=1844966 RepID=A0ABD2Q2A0_9PLAT
MDFDKALIYLFNSLYSGCLNECKALAIKASAFLDNTKIASTFNECLTSFTKAEYAYQSLNFFVSRKINRKKEDLIAKFMSLVPELDALKDHPTSELNLLVILLEVNHLVGSLHFIDPMWNLKNATIDLHRMKQIRKLKNPTSIAVLNLYNWLDQFHKNLLAKSSLYWFVIFQKHALNNEEINSIISLDKPDFIKM